MNFALRDDARPFRRGRRGESFVFPSWRDAPNVARLEVEQKERRMKHSIRRRLDMAGRVLDFSRAHPGSDPSYAGILSRLENGIEKAEQLARQQRGGQIAVHASTARRRELRRALHDQLRHLARVGDVVAKAQPQLAQHFQLPSWNASGPSYRTAAGAMLNEAVAQRDLLLQNGMASTLLDDLGEALRQYGESVEQAQAGRRAHVGAVAELAVVTSEIMEVVQLLDGLNRYRFRTNADLHAEWESARNIVAAPRPVDQSRGDATGGASSKSAA
jgi:hypothetical protein